MHGLLLLLACTQAAGFAPLAASSAPIRHPAARSQSPTMLAARKQRAKRPTRAQPAREAGGMSSDSPLGKLTQLTYFSVYIGVFGKMALALLERVAG